MSSADAVAPLRETDVTAAIAERAATLRFQDLTPDAVTVAGQCLLDWFAVTIAGAAEPLTRMLVAEAGEEGGNAQASLIGAGRGTLAQAALINGAAAHALDYDDVHQAMKGHPTVPLVPAILALGESLGASGQDLITAFVAGYETECRVGLLVAPGHYARGFHATATIGCFGAAAASANLLGLDSEATARALGIVGTQAAGLKSQFGTMCKPLHAGHAAASGLQAARLARRGFTSRSDILEAEQGFADTHSDDFEAEAALADAPEGFFVRGTLFKYHAACYLTHSTIEALAGLRRAHDIDPATLDSVTLEVDPGHLKVCHIEEPATGLEVKFSQRHTAAMALSGIDTANPETYTDAVAGRPDLVALRRRVEVRPTGGPGTLATAAVSLDDGRRLQSEIDVGIPAADLAAQGARLRAKYESLVAPLLGAEASAALLADLVAPQNLADANHLTRHLNQWTA